MCLNDKEMEQRKEYIRWIDKNTDPECKLQSWVIYNNFFQLKAMNKFMHCVNDETYLIDWWFYEWPDECPDDEILKIAQDVEAFQDMVRTFMHIMQDFYEKNDLYNFTYTHGKIDEDRKVVEDD